MRKNGITVILSAFVVLLFALAGCSTGDSAETLSNSDLSGVWILDDEFSPSGVRIPSTIEFFSDGTVQSDWSGTYSVDSNRLNISYSAMDSYSYTFSLNGDELILRSSGDYSSDATEYRYVRNSTQNEDDSSLAASCDEILAEGTNEKGDTYQLVLNYAENVNAEETVGVIKNNAWLIEPTTDCPFKKDDIATPTEYAFVLGNCFYISGSLNNPEQWNIANYQSIWNVETNQYYETENGWDHFLIDYRQYYTVADSNKKYIEKGNKVLIRRESTEAHLYDLLNVENMQIEKSFTTDLYLCPLSDGLIYGYDYNGTSAFFDEDLSLVLDISNLSKYMPREDSAAFVDGVCTLCLIDNNGRYNNYQIDKEGNILSREQLD